MKDDDWQDDDWQDDDWQYSISLILFGLLITIGAIIVAIQIT